MDVIGIDSPCVDFLVNIEQLPKPNESIRMLDYSWQGGGKVATALVTLARLGAKCGVIGSVGSDIYGRFCKEDFEYHGIDTSCLRIENDYETSLSLVMSDRKTRGRNIIYHAGNTKPISPADLNRDYIVSAKFLHLSRVDDTAILAAKWARENGVKVSFDADGYSDATRRFIPHIDVFIGSEFYYNALFRNSDYEKNCLSLLKAGPEIVVFTFGARGCVGMDKDGFFTEPTFDVPVVDTVGAGDVFHGAFVFALLQGWGARRAARFSNAVSSIKCTGIGGRAAIPDYETVMLYMQTGEIDFDKIDARIKHYRGGIQYV